MAFIADQGCFVCGVDNPIGMRLTFHQEEDAYVTTFIADAGYQGYQGVIHGGILATVLDEVMARYVWEQEGPAATARLEIHYRHPAPVGQPITVRGWIRAKHRGGRAVETAATASLADGTTLAEATGLIVRIDLPRGENACQQSPP